MREFLKLLGVARQNHRYRKELRRQEKRQLGDRSWYRALDRALTRVYRWSDPFRLSKSAKASLTLPAQDLVFGETPILTAWHILMSLGVDQADHVIELGGGRGIFSLVAASAFGSTATMLEVVPTFVRRTRQVASSLGLARVAVRQADILAHPLPEGTVYFLTATTFSPASWARLEEKLSKVGEGVKCVSLSAPLDSAHWRIDSEARLPFSWGENTVFFLTRKGE